MFSMAKKAAMLQLLATLPNISESTTTWATSWVASLHKRLQQIQIFSVNLFCGIHSAPETIVESNLFLRNGKEKRRWWWWR